MGSEWIGADVTARLPYGLRVTDSEVVGDHLLEIVNGPDGTFVWALDIVASVSPRSGGHVRFHVTVGLNPAITPSAPSVTCEAGTVVTVSGAPAVFEDVNGATTTDMTCRPGWVVARMDVLPDDLTVDQYCLDTFRELYRREPRPGECREMFGDLYDTPIDRIEARVEVVPVEPPRRFVVADTLGVSAGYTPALCGGGAVTIDGPGGRRTWRFVTGRFESAPDAACTPRTNAAPATDARVPAPPPPAPTTTPQVHPPGLFCRDLAAAGATYLEAVEYWFDEGSPDRMDADGDGIPCETVYAPDEVADYWGW